MNGNFSLCYFDNLNRTQDTGGETIFYTPGGLQAATLNLGDVKLERDNDTPRINQRRKVQWSSLLFSIFLDSYNYFQGLETFYRFQVRFYYFFFIFLFYSMSSILSN